MRLTCIVMTAAEYLARVKEIRYHLIINMEDPERPLNVAFTSSLT
jgi:hypothetical protein